MALFNKLFPRDKATQSKTHEDNVSHKSPTFSTDQIRIVLFRECDFRGRKLLFDSNATEKIPVDKANQDKTFVEVTNGFGYLISNQKSDYHQLSEMIFGSVAMSFQGSYFKIHHLSDPSRLMFTHVFQSPHTRKQRMSTSSQPSRLSVPSSFEHSIRLDDSGTSSTFSTSEQLSDRSTASDTILVCRRLQSSPLDVPRRLVSSISKNSLVVDSGCADHSFSSVSTGPINFSTWESVFSSLDSPGRSFSSCYAFKKLLRNSTRSLKQSSTSLPSSSEEVLRKSHQRVSKLGLSIVVDTPAENKDFLTLFFMEHIALLDAIVWRTRQSIELAYHRPNIFISSMVNIAQTTAWGLVNLLNAPRILINLWHCLSTDCDNRTSINASVPKFNCQNFISCRNEKTVANVAPWSENKTNFNGYSKLIRTDVFNFNLTNFLRTDSEKNGKRSLDGDCFIGEKFLKEFCELIEVYDVKNTNFFISTLLTAVLTHHLGWVTTVCSSDDGTIISKQPYNALWGQLIDLYGAVGYPAKTAQTVITGTNKNHVITKILNSLTYFIRFNTVERKNLERVNVDAENSYAEMICSNNNCIPKEYYKRYEDHLKEMLPDCASSSYLSKKTEEAFEPLRRGSRLNFSDVEDEKHSSFLKSMNRLKKVKTRVNLSEIVLKNEVDPHAEGFQDDGRLLRRLSTVLSENLREETIEDEPSKENLEKLNTSQLEKKTELEKQGNCDINQNIVRDKSNVIFVLGEDEKLVGIKKEEAQTELNIASGAKRKVSTTKRPSSLSLVKMYPETSKRTETKSTDFSKTDKRCLISSSSFESLCLDEKKYNIQNTAPKNVLRAQSEPPENKKLTNPKYPYSQVKFNLQQYPQVVKNYMKSKNIELEGLSLGEKVFDKFATVQHNVSLDFSGYESDSEQVEGLQTPSNASEMEFTTDMCIEVGGDKAKEATKVECVGRMMKLISIPMPKTITKDEFEPSVPYPSTVMKGLVENYIPDMVLQGTTSRKTDWESKLKRNLTGHTQHSLLDQPVEESLAIVANIDDWEVQLISSHTYIIDKGSSGVRIGMSQLVSSMLESLLQMWKSHIPAQHCLLHLEQKLQELCLRSRALAEVLLASEFCNIELLTSALKVEVNDVPLLLAVASTHSPEVTEKYGVSFQ
ncbi:folliculin-interacting protein 1 isoform X2 [Sitophilus oryzae]|uniref:Folliculin-interacting protein 1 isoform X1 n=1 Tax=Sitophilus oryzae TaxID=7048 RepID=A0A6J2YYD0_SITOR|nr:folliculin-interacting protein 1 isoform X1 [Sitophilus oryzae]XP_030767831.1 folliculin-interacting protein 1 isoform X2 [Sitophilus oryzae]